MRTLLLSGLGPSIKNDQYLEGSLLEQNPSPQRADRLSRWSDAVGQPDLRLDRLRWRGSRLLQPRRDRIPHLSTFVLRAILDRCPGEYDHVDTHAIWDDDPYQAADHYDVVLLSTTFIWEARSLRRAVDWLSQRWPKATVVLGGQYSNLKFARILRECPSVDYIVRGDGEHTLPALLEAISGHGEIALVPNLVVRNDAGRLVVSEVSYVDLETEPSPGLIGAQQIVPYESMRGCPFKCGFCSFPHASPRWRHKSADKICDDWARYAKDCGTRLVKAMDSTFTIPPRRMHRLFEKLPALEIGWEAYSRANTIESADYVERLGESHCRSLSIGFESMSDRTLTAMDKGVTVAQNRRAFELLSQGAVGYRCSFMVGYPGETPEQWEKTRDFLLHEYSGYYIMSVFSLQDETMPVWSRADEFGLTVDHSDDYDYRWTHDGMDEPTARSLLNEALDAMRTGNDDAVLMHWQAMYEHPLMPSDSRRHNLRVEKLIERLAMAPKDFPDPSVARSVVADHVTDLRELGVELAAVPG